LIFIQDVLDSILRNLQHIRFQIGVKRGTTAQRFRRCAEVGFRIAQKLSVPRYDLRAFDWQKNVVN
jgi:hypothetical protein